MPDSIPSLTIRLAASGVINTLVVRDGDNHTTVVYSDGYLEGYHYQRVRMTGSTIGDVYRQVVPDAPTELGRCPVCGRFGALDYPGGPCDGCAYEWHERRPMQGMGHYCVCGAVAHHAFMRRGFRMLLCDACHADLVGTMAPCTACGLMCHGGTSATALTQSRIPSGVVTPDGVMFCGTCHERSFRRCRTCGAMSPIGPMVCSCGRLLARPIRNYSYRPPWRIPDGEAYGCEVELEYSAEDSGEPRYHGPCCGWDCTNCGDCSEDDIEEGDPEYDSVTVRDALEILIRRPDIRYPSELDWVATEDSTIEHGAEWKSPPRAIGDWSLDQVAWIDTLRRHGWHSAPNVGIHVHVSRIAVDGLESYWQDWMAREWMFYAKLSGRPGNRMRDWCALPEHVGRHCSSSHSVALNVGDATVECRIWASSADSRIVLGSIQSTAAMVATLRRHRGDADESRYRALVREGTQWEWARHLLALRDRRDTQTIARGILCA